MGAGGSGCNGRQQILSPPWAATPPAFSARADGCPRRLIVECKAYGGVRGFKCPFPSEASLLDTVCPLLAQLQQFSLSNSSLAVACELQLDYEGNNLLPNLPLVNMETNCLEYSHTNISYKVSGAQWTIPYICY